MCPICHHPVVIDPVLLRSGELAHRRCSPTKRSSTPAMPAAVIAQFKAQQAIRGRPHT